MTNHCILLNLAQWLQIIIISIIIKLGACKFHYKDKKEFPHTLTQLQYCLCLEKQPILVKVSPRPDKNNNRNWFLHLMTFVKKIVCIW